jgi:hypothetical protein
MSASIWSPAGSQGTYEGEWNASTNSPYLQSGKGDINSFYQVSVSGTTSIDGEASWEIGNYIWFDGVEWKKIVDKFAQAGAGSVGRTVQEKLREWVSLADKGGVGDGVADDRAAIVQALAMQKPIRWMGTSGNTFRFTSPILHTVTADSVWHGEGSSLVYAGSHAEYAIRLNDATGVAFDHRGVTIDGAKLCNKPFEVLNNTNLSTPSTFSCDNFHIKRAKRSNAFSGGEAMLIRGAFDFVHLGKGGVSDCELPTGQGTPGAIGIAGVGITWYSTTSYVRRVTLEGWKTDKVYSSDGTYTSDQDGLYYFAPDDASGLSKVDSQLVVHANSRFTNCYGRSIKTQIMRTIVHSSLFKRTEGLTAGVGNVEVDAQTGSLLAFGNTCDYRSGQQPGVVFNASSDTQYGKPGLSVYDNEVYLDGSTTLTTFASTFPRSGTFSKIKVTDNKIFGPCTQTLNYLVNGSLNYAEVANNYVKSIPVGATSQRALVYVRASGATSPFAANVTAHGNVTDDANSPAIVRDTISGESASCELSAWNNIRFANDFSTRTRVGGLKTNQVARLGRFTSGNIGAYMEILTKILPGNGQETFSVNNTTCALIFVQIEFAQNAYAFVSTTGTANTGISVGSSVAVGNTTDPGSGTFRIWSSGTNEITVKNTNGSDRTCSMIVFVPQA